MVSRNVTRARVRLSSEQSRAHVGADDLPRDSVGNIIAEPSSDLISQVSEDALPSQTPFPALGPTWNTIGNPTAPKRDPGACSSGATGT